MTDKTIRYNTYFTLNGVRKSKVYESNSTDSEKIRKKIQSEYKGATNINIRQNINASEGEL
jgi:hypothetical protein